jgi:hypothetical protein
MPTMISEHFALEEFACKDGSPYPVDQPDLEVPGETWGESRLGPLVETLEVIRGALGGRPLHVDSGYRTLAYDQLLYDRSVASGGGANDKAPPLQSQHPKGRAADIRTGSLAPVELRDLIGALYVAGKLPHLGGLGLYTSFVHVDVRARPGNHLAQWGGRRLSNVP